MEFEWNISQDSPHCSSSTESKSSWTKWATQHNSTDELSSCRCSMTSCGDLKTTKRNVLLIPHLCLHSQKDFKQDVGHSSDLDQNQSGIPPMKDLEENGTKSLNWWWSNSEKADTLFSVPRVRSLEECSKAQEVENYLFTCVPMGIRLKLFVAQSFLSISSVSTEQSQICVKNSVGTRTGRLVVAEQSDPIFAPADLLIKTPTPSIEILAQENLLQKYKRTSGKASTTRSIDKDMCWCRIPENSWSRTTLHDKTYWRVLTLCRASDMSWVFVTTRRQVVWPERLDSREHQNWARVRSHNQLLAR